MEEHQRKCELGGSCTVETWIGEDVSIQWAFDQTKPLSPRHTHEVLPESMLPGDILMRKGCGDVVITSMRYDEKDKLWLVAFKDQMKPLILRPDIKYKIRRS